MENFIHRKVPMIELMDIRFNLKTSQDTSLVTHEVHEIFHSVIFHKLKEGPSMSSVFYIFDLKVQINKLHL
jgi:hypothetical protein